MSVAPSMSIPVTDIVAPDNAEACKTPLELKTTVLGDPIAKPCLTTNSFADAIRVPYPSNSYNVFYL